MQTCQHIYAVQILLQHQTIYAMHEEKRDSTHYIIEQWYERYLQKVVEAHTNLPVQIR